MSSIRSYFVFIFFLLVPSSFAGDFYIETENNTELIGTDFKQTRSDLHLGFEGNANSKYFSYYIQAGKSLVAEDDVKAIGRFSGEIGMNITVNENMDFYSDMFLLSTNKDNFKRIKLGAKYKF